MTTQQSKIIYTITDEAPALATHSFLPIIQKFTASSDINIEAQDISLAARIISRFPDYLNKEQQIDDALGNLGELVKSPEANIIKLPNISASIPQLIAAIKELQNKGYNVPDYPEEAATEEEIKVKNTYDKIKGSAVNPVLREGNSDRRAPKAVKQYARHHPHAMGEWSSDSKSHVVSMSEGDFYGSEKSVTINGDTSVNIEFITANEDVTILKKGLLLKDKEVIDASSLSKKALVDFFETEIEKAKQEDVLLSLHMKATMMKVSDPVIFGHAVKVYYKDLFDKYSDIFGELGIDANNGIGNVHEKIDALPDNKKAEIEADIANIYSYQPELAMVNSDKGITNLHVPSDVIIDASMPAALRSSGKMWGVDGGLKDTKAMIPDRCYAGIYQTVIDFCKKNGAFDPTTMGSVPNVGLMAQKAEEYGSHDKTFILPEAGKVRVVDNKGDVLIEHLVDEGDIWRMCQTKDAPIQNWVQLAVSRANITKNPTVFWLDKNRSHDAELIKKVNHYLSGYDTSELDINIMSPTDAMEYTLQHIVKGEDIISVTGNVLRDYLTDLFPILEVGTSAKMLSIVPLMNGGGLFETGAGGSAPKLVQQFEEENHLRWDSLGEFLALSASLEHLSHTDNNSKAKVLAETLDLATAKFLEANKSPKKQVGELDNRGSHFYLAMYWAQELSEQTKDSGLKTQFSPIFEALSRNEIVIIDELNRVQGSPVTIGGYYQPDSTLAGEMMRPSDTFNRILDNVK